jgi:predicted amidohydrolase
MRLALWQGPSPQGDLEAAMAVVRAGLTAARALRAAALVMPEAFLPGYNHPGIAALAIAPDDPILEALSSAAAAAGTALIIGYAEADGGKIYNSALAFGEDGLLLARYRKIQLYGPREKAIYTPGDAYTTFQLEGRKAALLICYDVEFAHHIKALADMGVEIILVPTANMVPFSYVVDHTVAAMAANHGLSIVYANYCGQDGDLTYLGGSLIAGPHGEILAQAGPGPALLIADLPPHDPARLTSQSADLRVI